MTQFFSRPAAALAVVLVATVGCGDTVVKAKVTGSVTFNGKPVPDGYITFRPADGKGADAGGPIVNGSYTLSAVPVGAKIVSVTSAGSNTGTTGAMSSEDASKRKVDAKAAAEAIPANAKGQDTKVEVKAGDQSFDFALKSN